MEVCKRFKIFNSSISIYFCTISCSDAPVEEPIEEEEAPEEELAPEPTGEPPEFAETYAEMVNVSL